LKLRHEQRLIKRLNLRLEQLCWSWGWRNGRAYAEWWHKKLGSHLGLPASRYWTHSYTLKMPRFKASRFKTSRFKMSSMQNVHNSKYPDYVQDAKHPGFKMSIFFILKNLFNKICQK
jgi:hypothetical protein